MKAIIVSMLFTIFHFVSFSQTDIPNIGNSVIVINENNNEAENNSAQYELYIHSSHRCGFCRRLRNDFQQVEIPENIKVIFMEYDTPKEAIVDQVNTYKGSEVRMVENYSYESISLFPYSQLVDVSNNQVVKNIKGYRKNFWTRIIKKAS